MAKVIKGEDIVLVAYVRTPNGQAFPLTGATAIEVKIPNASGGTISKTLSGGTISIISASDGQIGITISDSDDLKVAQNQQLEVIVDFGTTRRIFRLVDTLDVLAQLF
jgi:hypothetical protein